MTESHPTLLALLEEARLAPHDDAPRLVLADWLEDRGDGARAEILRLQCLWPRQAASQERCRALLGRHGGAWLGPLRPAAGEGLLRRLLGKLPLGRHLTHLASDPPWSPEQEALIRGHGVEPAHAGHDLWMHALPPAAFRAATPGPWCSPARRRCPIPRRRHEPRPAVVPLGRAQLLGRQGQPGHARPGRRALRPRRRAAPAPGRRPRRLVSVQRALGRGERPGAIPDWAM